MILDLTLVIDERTPVFPDDPLQEIQQIATIKEKGWNEKRLAFNSHFGTHIDAPFHMLVYGKKLDEFPLETFFGEAVVIDVRGQKEIHAELHEVKKGDIVFFCTGHSKNVYSDYFYNNPVLSEETARKLVEKKVKIVGIDSFSPDNHPFTVHKILLGKDILIVENLVNLEKLAGERVECVILPLKIKDADGAPCRVVARQ